MHNVDTAPYQSFQKVFEQHYNALCNYAYSFLKDESSSEDVVQEVFIRIWEKKQELIQAEAIRFYLFTSVRNNCLTALQKEKKAAMVELKEYNIADTDAAAPMEGQPEKDYTAQLAAAMNQLPQKCREVFELSRISKLSYKEIADTLEISVKTVENQIGKALKILRAYLKSQHVFIAILLIISLFL